ncbi:MAG TPA: hypothetical protein VM008_02705 [Phycisphaerae bacterium]|nr:hypothetical protein [Phycisphaerae bacterium]
MGHLKIRAQIIVKNGLPVNLHLTCTIGDFGFAWAIRIELFAGCERGIIEAFMVQSNEELESTHDGRDARLFHATGDSVSPGRASA